MGPSPSQTPASEKTLQGPTALPLTRCSSETHSRMFCSNFHCRASLSDPKLLHAVNWYLKLLQAASQVQRSRNDGKGVTYGRAPLGDGDTL